MSAAPLVDPRTAATLREELLQKLRGHVPEWSAVDPVSGQRDQAAAALVGICARFGEIVIQRLNQVPDKNFLAFLDLLGVSRNPPQPARVPLTFTLAQGSVVDAVVPAGTQVAAPPAEGDSEPVLFETERELPVVAATLQSLITVEAERDMVADHSALLASPDAAGRAIFSGDRSNEHLLYVGHGTDLTTNKVTQLSVTLHLNAQPAENQREIVPADLRWEVWDGTTWSVIAPANVIQPANLNGEFRFSNLPTMPALTLSGISSHWLRCRLLKPISPGATAAAGMLRAPLLPVLDAAHVRATAARSGITPDAAFANAQAVDVTKPFLPFGERPKLGDAFYVGSTEGFGLPGASVSLVLPVVNPLPPPPAQGPVVPSPTLRWEVWTSAGWTLLGESSRTATGTSPLVDTTRAFTNGLGTSASITLPAGIAPTTINGETSHWIRVQIAGGNYGEDARYVSAGTPPVFTLQPATFVPPMLRSLTLGYSFDTPEVPAAVLGYNNLEFENLGADPSRPFGQALFRGFSSQPATLYMAFSVPEARKTFPNRAISLYHALRSFQYGELATPLHPDLSVLGAAANTVATHRFTVSNPGREVANVVLSTQGGAWQRALTPTSMRLDPGESRVATVAVTVPDAQGPGAATASDRGFLQLSGGGVEALSSVAFETRVGASGPPRRRLRWEYWNGHGWSRLIAADGTDRLSRTGVIEFLGPADLTLSRQFGIDAYWVRALLEAGDQPLVPRVRALAPNTTMASQVVTLRTEVIGSSDASEHQQFRTVRTPVLLGQQLEVREPGPLAHDELAQLTAVHGTDAVTAAGTNNEFWVRWTEVPDLHGAGPLDRHYVLDHLSGQVTFGDGVQGRIPPRGVGNLRLARYQAGGGQRGNCPAGSIVQMKTTVPYVDRVTNIDAAASGFDAESTTALVTRAPRTLRHGGRAVAADDYEDLARLASAEVARARCVPLRRLREDPLGSVPVPGALSLIIVPGSSDPKPLPSLELLELTAGYLRTRQAANADISLVGPLYVRVDVAMEVALARIENATEVDRAIRGQLAAFLHPLTGGRDGAGWDFGRKPQLSDLHALINGVAGVDHLRKLTVSRHEDLAGTEATGRFLVYSGQHQIDFSFTGGE
jgi:predicted phage baseplate assembly protein